MRINIKAVLKNYKGKKLTRGDGTNYTVRDALNDVINGVEMKPQGSGRELQPAILSAEDKGRIYQLSTKLWSVRKTLKLSPEEIVFIKKRKGVVANITPLVFGKVGELLEDKDEEEKKVKDSSAKA